MSKMQHFVQQEAHRLEMASQKYQVPIHDLIGSIMAMHMDSSDDEQEGGDLEQWHNWLSDKEHQTQYHQLAEEKGIPLMHAASLLYHHDLQGELKGLKYGTGKSGFPDTKNWNRWKEYLENPANQIPGKTGKGHLNTRAMAANYRATNHLKAPPKHRVRALAEGEVKYANSWALFMKIQKILHPDEPWDMKKLRAKYDPYKAQGPAAVLNHLKTLLDGMQTTHPTEYKELVPIYMTIYKRAQGKINEAGVAAEYRQRHPRFAIGNDEHGLPIARFHPRDMAGSGVGDGIGDGFYLP